METSTHSNKQGRHRKAKRVGKLKIEIMKKLYTYNLSSAFSRWSNIINIFTLGIKGLPMFLFAVLIPAICAGQQAGDLDVAFASGGKQTTDVGFDDIGYSVAIQADGKIVVAGETYNGTDSDFAIVRYLGSSGSVGIVDNTYFDLNSSSVFPNPFQHTAILKVSGPIEINSTLVVYNTLGQIVYTQAVSSNETDLHLELASGIYNYVIINKTKQLKSRGKFAIQ